MFKKFVAEFLGTAVLVILGCGVAATCDSMVGIALAFGLAIVALAYSIGHISGCHVNPAVSTAMLISGKLTVVEFCGSVVSQFLGATFGAFLLYAMFTGNATEYFNTHALGTNGYGTLSATGINVVGAFVAEAVLTFVFLIAILGVTSKASLSNVAGVVIGLTLTLVHLLGLPLTGTSVNPARSFGAAFVSMLLSCHNGNEAFKQVWLFIIAPLVGAAIAALCWKLLGSDVKDEPAPAPAPAAAPAKQTSAPAQQNKKKKKR